MTADTEVAAPPGRLPRLLPDGFAHGPVSLAQHVTRYGPLPGLSDRGRAGLLAEVERSGLTGRGGAGFPAARKLNAVRLARRRAGTAVVVANGTEGEPASAKDKVLLACSPHLVLDGAAIAAGLVGAGEAVIVAPASVRDAVTAAVAERATAGLREPARWRVVTAAEGFVAGEASAVVHWIARGIPKPTGTPPHLAERGLRGAPTLVHNVETLAHLALIARRGADWFRSAGTPDEPGSMLVTVLGAVRDPRVLEIAIGTAVSDVLDLAGGPPRPLRALLLGGYSGSWVAAAPAGARPLSGAGLADLGAGVGAGLIAALPEDACGLAETARVARYLAAQSAGQCGPCLFGLDAIAGAVEQLADGRSADTSRLDRWLSQVARRGACGHPDGAVRLVRSALAEFTDERQRHAAGWCCGRTRVLPIPPVRSR